MNGLTEINVGGTQFPLLFGRLSVEIITKNLTEDTMDTLEEQTIELVYAGMRNYAHAKRLPKPKWVDVYEICQQLFDEDDFVEQIKEINTVFEESRFGSELIAKLDDVKKKIQAEEEKLKALIGST